MHWRDQKERMRRTVNATFRLPAMLYREGAVPSVVWVRLHDVKETYHGDLQGTSAHMALAQDQNPLVVSLIEHYSPLRGDVLCFRPGEAYRVDNVHLPDFISVTSEVLPIIDAADLMNFTPPPADAVPP